MYTLWYAFTYGKSPSLIGKSTIYMAIFNSKLLVHQMVNHYICNISHEIQLNPCSITSFNGKTHYFYGHFQQPCSSLPEGKAHKIPLNHHFPMVYRPVPVVLITHYGSPRGPAPWVPSCRVAASSINAPEVTTVFLSPGYLGNNGDRGGVKVMARLEQCAMR